MKFLDTQFKSHIFGDHMAAAAISQPILEDIARDSHTNNSRQE